MGYSYINENGKKVNGRAADNHWLSANGFKRVNDLIDYVAIATAEQIKKGLDDEQKALNRRNQIKKVG
ncbi:MAG: hypothetical protein K2I80_00335 [Ruminococcus sp.]|nr:hypothetical protein [Ruminococcus sp.]MDE6847994.1 hypothetical protein [Ruminococcus sp.]